MLTIRGQHEESKEEEEENFLRRERSYKSFSRSLALPPHVDPNTIEASCHDGVLEVTVPGPKEQVPQSVTIKPKVVEGSEQSKTEGEAQG